MTVPDSTAPEHVLEEGEAPIFADLLAEHGDVLTHVREAVQEVRQEAATALDFSGLHRDGDDEGLSVTAASTAKVEDVGPSGDDPAPAAG